MAYADYSEISVIVDVHLAHVGHALNASIVRYESNALWPNGARLDEAEAPADYGTQSISANNEARAQLVGLAFVVNDGDSAYAAGIVRKDIGHACPFLNARARGFRAAQNYVVQNCSSDCQPLVTEWCEAEGRGKFAVRDVAVGS